MLKAGVAEIRHDRRNTSAKTQLSDGIQLQSFMRIVVMSDEKVMRRVPNRPQANKTPTRDNLRELVEVAGVYKEINLSIVGHLVQTVAVTQDTITDIRPVQITEDMPKQAHDSVLSTD